MLLRRLVLLMSLVALCVLARSAVTEDKAPDKTGVVRYVRFQSQDKVAYGIVQGGLIRELAGDFNAWQPTERMHVLSEVQLLAPATPSKVLALAGNYQSHLGEKPPFKNPEFFFKPASSIVGPGAEIVLPEGATDTHYEAELVIVIGRRAKNVEAKDAAAYVLGVTCGNDVSERVWQKGDVQWWRAKGSDTFGPCGPYIVSGLDYDNLQLQLRLNGEVRQSENTKDMVHDVAATVSWASKHVTLEAGDLIFTGTPQKSQAMKPGDVVEVELEGVGVLKNSVVAEKTE